MRRDEHEEHLRRLEYEYRQRLEEAQNRLNELHKNYNEALKNAGLSIEKGVVRYADDPSKTSIAPTYEAERLAKVRSYEVKTRMADIEGIAIDGVQAVINVYSKIEANKPMPPALEDQLREIQEETKKATNFLIAKHAGYADYRDNRYYQ